MKTSENFQQSLIYIVAKKHPEILEMTIKAQKHLGDPIGALDIIEEIARIYGYDNIPVDNSLYGIYTFHQTDFYSNLQHIRESLSGLGFYQIYSNSLQSENIANISKNNSVPMMNPLSKDMSFLRTSLLPGLLKAADFNIKNSSSSFKLYELGSVHTQLGNKIEDISKKIYY